MARFYITTPIFYPNAKLHMGHAYTTTLADIIARYHRLAGDDTYFLTGSDENTEKVVRAAEKAGRDPKEYLDEIVGNFKELFSALNISYDQFIRTTDEELHWPGAQVLWEKLVASGDIYKKTYSGLYCTGHESFITEKELVDGKCPDHDEAPEQVTEENYFFALSKYTDMIKERISSGELRILPETREREILSLLERGLEDVSFSRPAEKMTFGIPVPDDPSQKMYVWCDALSNYITALGYGRGEERMEYWPGTHVIGKDILRFHAAIWPGMLLSAGLPLPKTILVHGFITSGGRKMSKTLGNVIDPDALIATYGSEAVRAYLARHISPFEDGDITEEGFRDAYNADLANGLGNLAARIMKLAEDNLAEPVAPGDPDVFPKEYTDAFAAYRVHQAAEYVWSRIHALDGKITETEPFRVVKTDKAAGQELVRELALELYKIARLLEPFLPEASETIKRAVLENKKPETLFARK